MDRTRSGGRRRARGPVFSSYIDFLSPAGLLPLAGFVANVHEPSEEQHSGNTRPNKKIKQVQTNISSESPLIINHWTGTKTQAVGS